jgi:phosphomannomutase
VDYCGYLPSPALAYYAMQNGMPSIMVTGSHIPADRNGVKFTKRTSEVLKSDEVDILLSVKQVREQENDIQPNESLFSPDGSLKRPPSPLRSNCRATDLYIRRYLDSFRQDCLLGLRIVVYQHSAVGRDIIVRVFQELGAEVIAPANRINVSYIDEEKKAETTMDVDLRSEVFVPVDTEKITGQTKAVLKHLAQTYHPDFIVSADGDTDRPLLADESGEFVPGDKLGFLALKFLMRGKTSCFVALPISTNDGVVSGIDKLGSGSRTSLTKIGSPYIVSAMLNAPDHDLIVGWEANGGFLLGSDVVMFGRKLGSLPTRDSILPLLAAILLAKQERKTVSQIIADELEPRISIAGVTDNTIPGAEMYTSDVGRKLIQSLSPSDGSVKQVAFDDSSVHIEYTDGSCTTPGETSVSSRGLLEIRDRIGDYFSVVNLCSISAINYVDGVRVTFAEDNVVYHMRPSGNAPEFRSYVTANTLQQASQVLLQGRTVVIPNIIRDIVGDGV